MSKINNWLCRVVICLSVSLIPSAPSVFLLFSQRNITSRILLDASADPLDAVLPIQGMRNIRALDFDPVDNLIYWVDGRTKSIRRSRVNGTDVSRGSVID